MIYSISVNLIPFGETVIITGFYVGLRTRLYFDGFYLTLYCHFFKSSACPSVYPTSFFCQFRKRFKAPFTRQFFLNNNFTVDFQTFRSPVIVFLYSLLNQYALKPTSYSCSCQHKNKIWKKSLKFWRLNKPHNHNWRKQRHRTT